MLFMREVKKLKKYPFVKQRSLKDCGVASLLMIIKYYGGNVNFDTLEEMCKISKKGISAFHLIQAGEMIGLKGKGCHLNLNKMKPSMLPCIVHVTTKQNFFHYMVLYEIRKKDVIVGDPAIGIQKIKLDDFTEMFNETVLIFKPVRVLPKEEKIQNMFSWILSYLKIYHHMLIRILFYSLITIFLIISTSFSVQLFLYGVKKKQKFLITIFLSVFLMVHVLKTIFLFIRNRKIIHLDRVIDTSLTKEVFHRIISLPFSYYHNKTVGEIMNRFSDIPLLKNVITEIFIEDSLSILLSICSFFVLIFMNKNITLYAIIFMFITIFISTIHMPELRRKIKKYKESRERFVAFTYESFENYETIKGSHKEKEIQKQFDRVFEEYQKEKYEYQSMVQKIELTKSFIEQVSHLILLYFGVLMIIEKKLSISALFTLEFLLPIFLDPIYKFMEHMINIKESNDSFQRIINLFYEKKQSGFVEKEIDGNITFQNLTFSYDDHTNILENVNLNIKAKQKIMIIGKSGSGKSTLFYLLMGYYKVPRGMIFIDHIDINDYKTNTLNHQIVLLSQTENLFSDTIYNNLSFFEKKNPKKIINASEKSMACSVINQNELGYFYPLEENGLNLSGGERQKLMLSRTLLLKFSILLIDEGLNQIDEETERKILQNIFEEYKDKTILVISHRDKNRDLFDQIVNVKEGNIEIY